MKRFISILVTGIFLECGFLFSVGAMESEPLPPDNPVEEKPVEEKTENLLPEKILEAENALVGIISSENPAEKPPALKPIEKNESGLLRFNFRAQSYKEVVEWFAEQAGLSLEIATFPTGTFNYSDPNYYTPQEALDIINSVLLFKEYTLVRKGRMLFVLNLQDGIPPNLLEPISPAELDDRGKYEIVRCIWTLTRTLPEVIQAEVERMLGPQGNVITLPRSQQILITETAGTLRAIREIIKRIDDPTTATVGNIQIVAVKNVTADEALLTMRKLLAIEENDPSLRTVIDTTGTNIWLSGRNDMIEKAKDFLTRIDSTYQNDKPSGEPEIEVFDTGVADPTTVMAVLQTLLVGIPDVRLSLDPKTAAIVARARTPERALIRATIEQMQLNAESVVSIPLDKMSPQTAVDALRKIFPKPTTTSATASTTSLLPIIEADIAGRAVIVKATPQQLAQIREALLSLGETGRGTVIASSSTSPSVRTIPLSPAASAYVIEQLQEVWGTMHQNELKVVAPSGMIPARIPAALKTSSPTPPNSREPQKEMQRERRNAPADNTDTIDRHIDDTFETKPPQDNFSLSSAACFKEMAHTEPQWHGGERVENPLRVSVPPCEEKETPITLTKIVPSNKISLQFLANEETNVPATTPQNLPVVVSIGPNGLMLTSSDPEALAQLESLVRLLSDPTILNKSTLTIYYLKHSTAEVVSQMLQGIMGSGSVSQVVEGIRIEDASLVQAMGLLGGGASYEATGTLRITPEPRLNALFVQANMVDHRTIEKLLPILDQPEIPGGDPLNRPRPHLVTCQHIKAEEALARVKEVFADRMQSSSGSSGGGNTAAQGQQQNANAPRGGRGGNTAPPAAAAPQMMGGPDAMPPGMGGGPQAFLQAMMGQMGGNTQSNTRTAREAEQKMTLAIDARSNSLIVYAPDMLAADVTAFVREIDTIAGETETVMETYQLVETNMTTLRQALTSTAGDGVQFSTSSQSISPRGAVDITSSITGGSRSSRTTTGGTGANPFSGMFGGGTFGGNNNALGGNMPFGGNTFPRATGTTGTGGGMGGNVAAPGSAGGTSRGTTGTGGTPQRSTIANPR